MDNLGVFMENQSSLPVGSKGTILSLMTQELRLDAGKNIENTREKIATAQGFFHNDGVSLSCRTFLMGSRPKFRHSKQSEVLLRPTSSKSAPITDKVRKKSSNPFNENQQVAIMPATDSRRDSTCKSKSIRGSHVQKKYISFEKRDFSSSLDEDMPVQKEIKRNHLEDLIPILRTKLDPKAMHALQGSDQQECNRSQPIMVAEEFVTSDLVAPADLVKVVDMGCYSKGDLNMRSLAYWFGSHHHQAMTQQNDKADQRSVSFVKLQHYPSHHHHVP